MQLRYITHFTRDITAETRTRQEVTVGLFLGLNLIPIHFVNSCNHFQHWLCLDPIFVVEIGCLNINNNPRDPVRPSTISAGTILSFLHTLTTARGADNDWFYY